MTRTDTFGRAAARGIAVATAATAALALTSFAAFAGDCPAGQMKTGAMQPGATMPEGIAEEVLGAIDLSTFNPPLDGYQFRLRRLVVAPGGVVPWHSHAARPANIYIIDGAITEYRSTCAVPIEHKAGEVAVEFGADLEHWWKNNTGAPTVLIAADILPPAMKDESTM